MVTPDEILDLLVCGQARGVTLGMAAAAIPASLGPADWMLRPPKGTTLARYRGGLEVTTRHGRVALLHLRRAMRPKLARRAIRRVEALLLALGHAPERRVVEDALILVLRPGRTCIADGWGLHVVAAS